jgi:hypothetical protein
MLLYFLQGRSVKKGLLKQNLSVAVLGTAPLSVFSVPEKENCTLTLSPASGFMPGCWQSAPGLVLLQACSVNSFLSADLVR